jgi:hypothetical protein
VVELVVVELVVVELVVVEQGHSDCLQNRMNRFLSKLLLDHYLPHHSLHLVHH